MNPSTKVRILLPHPTNTEDHMAKRPKTDVAEVERAKTEDRHQKLAEDIEKSAGGFSPPPNLLEKLSDDDLEAKMADLKAEKARRAEATERKRLDAHTQYTDQLRRALTQELIDLLAPNHVSNACTDSCTTNCWYSEKDNSPGCMRCALLDTMGSGLVVYPFRYVIKVERDPGA